MLTCFLLAAVCAVPPPQVTWCDFESPRRVWTVGEGVQPGSSAELSTAQAHHGRQSAKLHYDFIEHVKGLQYVGLATDLTVALRPMWFGCWVYGNSSGQPVRLRLIDRSGETHQFDLGHLTFAGWRELRVRLADGGLSWGGDGNGRLDPPVRFDSVLIDSGVKPQTGDVWFDELSYGLDTSDAPLAAEVVPLPAQPRLDGEQARPTWAAATDPDGVCRVSYAFDPEPVRQHLDVVLDAPIRLPEELSLWICGDGGGQVLRAQMADSRGAVAQVTFGELRWTGWARCTARLDQAERWGGPAGEPLVPPIRLRALVLDRQSAGQGVVQFKDLRVLPARGPAVEARVGLVAGDEAPPAVAGAHVLPSWHAVRDAAVTDGDRAAWRLDYEFEVTPGLEYAELPLRGLLGAKPVRLRFRVKGDGSQNGLRVRVVDASGECHQYDLGALDSTDWREQTVPLVASPSHWGGDGNGRLDGPLRLESVLIDALVRPSKGHLWLSGVALDIALRPADAVVPVAATPDGSWLAADGQPLRCTLTWRDRREAATATKVDVQTWLRRGDDAPVPGSHESLVLPAGQPLAQNLALAMPGVGHYELVVVWRVDDDWSSTTIPLAKLPAQPEPKVDTNPFGACLHFAQGKGRLPLTFDLLRGCGGRWARDEYPWAAVETERGKYRFPEYLDRYLRTAHDRGVEPFLIFDYANPLYDHGQSPTSDEAQAAFAGYAAAMVRRYHGVCRYWEVFNEPNISFWKPKPDAVAYARLLKATYTACKQANPDCTIVGVCTAGVDLKFIETVLKAGGGAFMDALSVHPYCYPTSPEAAGFVAGLTKAHDLMVKYGMGAKPLWITEVGWPNHRSAGGVTEAATASYLVRMVSLARSLPFTGPVMWYDLQDDGPNPDYNEDNFGLLHTSFAPKKPYLAAALMGRVLGAKTFSRDLSVRPNVYAHLYSGGEQQTLVLWSTPLSTSVTLDLGATDVEVSDVTGRVTRQAVTAGKLMLEAGEMPVFISGRLGQVTVRGS